LIRHGHRIPVEAQEEEDMSEIEHGTKGWARGVSQQGDLVALLELEVETSEWQPKKVFFQT
jgi:tRNA pseudouridine55 synthase